MAAAAPATVHLEIGRAELTVSHEHPPFPLETGGLRFSFGNAEDADWLVQAFYVDRAVATSAPRERRILLMTEPRADLAPQYVNQFGILVSPFDIDGFDGVWVQSHGALPAFFGVQFQGGTRRVAMDYSDLIALPIPQKIGHDLGSRLAEERAARTSPARAPGAPVAGRTLGPRFAVYGRGWRDVADKAEAILPHKYHLVLENTVMPSYWTEKLADAWLGHAFPDRRRPARPRTLVPEDSFLAIDAGDADGAIAAIRRAHGRGSLRPGAARRSRRRAGACSRGTAVPAGRPGDRRPSQRRAAAGPAGDRAACRRKPGYLDPHQAGGRAGVLAGGKPDPAMSLAAPLPQTPRIA